MLSDQLVLLQRSTDRSRRSGYKIKRLEHQEEREMLWFMSTGYHSTSSSCNWYQMSLPIPVALFLEKSKPMLKLCVTQSIPYIHSSHFVAQGHILPPLHNYLHCPMLSVVLYKFVQMIHLLFWNSTLQIYFGAEWQRLVSLRLEHLISK